MSYIDYVVGEYYCITERPSGPFSRLHWVPEMEPGVGAALECLEVDTSDGTGKFRVNGSLFWYDPEWPAVRVPKELLGHFPLTQHKAFTVTTAVHHVSFGAVGTRVYYDGHIRTADDGTLRIGINHEPENWGYWAPLSSLTPVAAAVEAKVACKCPITLGCSCGAFVQEMKALGRRYDAGLRCWVRA